MATRLLRTADDNNHEQKIDAKGISMIMNSGGTAAGATSSSSEERVKTTTGKVPHYQEHQRTTDKSRFQKSEKRYARLDNQVDADSDADVYYSA